MNDIDNVDDLENASLQNALQALESTNKQLRSTNEELRNRFKSEWDQPRRVFYIVTAVAALVFGVNIGSQILTTVNIQSVKRELDTALKEAKDDTTGITSKLKNELDEAKGQRESHKSEFEATIAKQVAEFTQLKSSLADSNNVQFDGFKSKAVADVDGIRSELRNERESNRREFESINAQAKTLRTAYEQQIEELRRERIAALIADESANQVISYVGLAQESLYLSQDPHRAIAYLEAAYQEIERARQDIRLEVGSVPEIAPQSDDPLTPIAKRDFERSILSIIDRLELPVLVMRIQSHLELNEVDRIRTLVPRLNGCRIPGNQYCFEGQFYKAAIEVFDMLDFGHDDGRRKESRFRAIDELERASSANFIAENVLLYLAALHFDDGNYTKSQRYADKLLSQYPTSDAERWSSPRMVGAQLRE